MATLTSSLRQLYTFVSVNPYWVQHLQEVTKKNFCGSTEFWNAFFVYVYESKISLDDSRAWDDLLFKRRMMVAFRILLRRLARQGIHQLVQHQS